MISTLAQLLVTGIAMGFIYCLVAIEYTLIWNSTGLVNFAHDKFITLGAYFFGGTMYVLFGNNFVLCVIGTTVAMFLYGVVVSKVIFMPLSKMPTRIYAVTGTLMLSIIMRESILLSGSRTVYRSEVVGWNVFNGNNYYTESKYHHYYNFCHFADCPEPLL